MWELDHKESFMVIKSTKELMLLNCVVGEDSWESLESPKIKPVSSKENYSWIFIGRTDAEVPILWPPDAKNWLLRKDSDAGKDWRQEEMVTTEDEMVGWHHGLNGHEFWASSGSWWWTGKLSMLQSMGSQRVGYDLATEQQQRMWNSNAHQSKMTSQMIISQDFFQ